MNRKVAASVLVAVFVMVCLASPVIAPAASDAVLVLHFDEGSGTIAKDESGHGNDGTIHGATWTTGISGKALRFDGKGDFIEIPDDVSLDITDAITLEAWVEVTDVSEGYIISKGRDMYGLLTYMRDNGKLSFHIGGVSALKTPGTYNDGKWHHLVGTYDRNAGSNNRKLYVDGDEVNSDTQTLAIPLDNERLGLGVWGHESGYYWKGIIDEVAVYSRALTPEEIKAHYLAKRVGGSTKESASEFISSVSTRIDVLKRSNVDTSLIEEALKNAQDAFDLGNHDEAYELAQSALKMADDAYEVQQDIESAQSEIEDAKSIGADVKEAETKLKEAKDALNKGNYEYAHNWADEASELAKHASIGSVQIKDLKALAAKYDERTVVISGTIRDIETVYGEGYTFALDDGSGMISVAYQGSLGDIKDGDKVTASGIFEASTGTLVADNVQKSGVGGGGVPGFEVVLAVV